MNEIKDSRMRIAYFDYVKGLLIILVFFGHLTSEKLWWRKAIFHVSMPAFFIITGMIISAFGNKKDFIKRNLKGIAWPYLMFSLLAVIRQFLMPGMSFGQAILLLVQQICFWRGKMWFLPALFFAKNLAQIIICRCKKKMQYIVCGILIVVLSYTSNLIQYNDFFVNMMYTEIWHIVNFINKTAIGFVFVLFGYHFYPMLQEIISNRLWIPCAIGLLITTLLSQFSGMIDLNNSVIHNPVLFWIISPCGSICLIAIMAHIKDKSGILSYYGKNSLTMMAVTSVFPIARISRALCQHMINAESYMLCGVVGCLISLGLIVIINKIFPWLARFPKKNNVVDKKIAVR